MDALTSPRLLGVRIENAPPITDLFFRFEPGLTVLYGRNGAGKTRLLDGIAESIVGGESTHTTTLVYEWPSRPTDGFAELMEDYESFIRDVGPGWLERARWESLPGNPWRQEAILGAEFLTPDASEVREERASRNKGRRPVSPNESLDRLNGAILGAVADDESAIASLGLRLILSSEPWLLDALTTPTPHQDDVAILRLNVNAALEIARQARFAIRRSSNLRGPVTEMLTLGRIDEDTPALRSLAAELGTWEPSHSDEYFDLVELALERDLGQMVANAHSVVDQILGRPATPVWFGDTYLSQQHNGSGPALLVQECPQEDLIARTLDFVEHHLNPPLPPSSLIEYRGFAQPPQREHSSVFVRTTQDGFDINPDAAAVVAEISGRASEYFGLLLEGAPLLVARIHAIQLWPIDGVLAWIAIDPTGSEVDIERLSNAQARWARFAIQLATLEQSQLPLVMLLDEPEAALHRRAERHLVAGLTRLSAERGAHIISATHSPAFLGAGAAHLVHVHRGADGATEIESMNQEVRNRISELGLDTADLLQFCRAILLVEGQHEIVVLEALLGDTLQELGIEILCMRGATTLKTWDAQLIERFTDAPVVILVDNDQAERLQDVWHRARSAAEAGEPHLDIIDELKSKGRGSEGEFLRELCKNLITAQQPDRYHITAFGKPDLPEYFNLHDIAPEAPPTATWEEMRKRAQGARFKQWMEKQFNADYSDNNLRRAALRLDVVPDDFTDLLRYFESQVLKEV